MHLTSYTVTSTSGKHKNTSRESRSVHHSQSSLPSMRGPLWFSKNGNRRPHRLPPPTLICQDCVSSPPISKRYESFYPRDFCRCTYPSRPNMSQLTLHDVFMRKHAACEPPTRGSETNVNDWSIAACRRRPLHYIF